MCHVLEAFPSTEMIDTFTSAFAIYLRVLSKLQVYTREFLHTLSNMGYAGLGHVHADSDVDVKNKQKNKTYGVRLTPVLVDNKIWAMYMLIPIWM